MHEVRAHAGGTVSRIVVDEGQMVAEGDPVVVLDTATPILTDVPGVVRELHVDVASDVVTGDLVALIDES